MSWSPSVSILLDICELDTIKFYFLNTKEYTDQRHLHRTLKITVYINMCILHVLRGQKIQIGMRHFPNTFDHSSVVQHVIT